jgi:hypothetical protein
MLTLVEQILDAEAIEHMLGESDYIELSEISIPWEGKAAGPLSISLNKKFSCFVPI